MNKNRDSELIFLEMDAKVYHFIIEYTQEFIYQTRFIINKLFHLN